MVLLASDRIDHGKRSHESIPTVAQQESVGTRKRLSSQHLSGLGFPDLEDPKPSYVDDPISGTVRDIAAAMRGDAELGAAPHVPVRALYPQGASTADCGASSISRKRVPAPG
jgi:hypothetical protein